MTRVEWFKKNVEHFAIYETYETENGDSGAIAIFGPTRMEYRKVIPLLEYIAKHIKNIT